MGFTSVCGLSSEGPLCVLRARSSSGLLTPELQRGYLLLNEESQGALGYLGLPEHIASLNRLLSVDQEVVWCVIYTLHATE